MVVNSSESRRLCSDVVKNIHVEFCFEDNRFSLSLGETTLMLSFNSPEHASLGSMAPI